MGLIYRKRKRIGRNTFVNVSKSGVSGSERIGPVTLNSRGTGRVRIAPGLSFRFGTKKQSTKRKATYYQHPNCNVHHKTLQAAQRCSTKNSGFATSPHLQPTQPSQSQIQPVQPTLPSAGWYHGSSDSAGSVRYWDGMNWTSNFKP